MADDPARDWATELRQRIIAALAMADEVTTDSPAHRIMQGRHDPDSRTHSDPCHQWHADCLAARIRRTLTGEDPR